MPAKLTGDLTSRMRQGERRVAEAVQATAKDIVRGAQTRVPVDTGHLRSSIKAGRLADDQALVTVDTSDGRHDGYQRFVELGTRYQAAQPFFIPATEAAREPFRRRIRQAYKP